MEGKRDKRKESRIPIKVPVKIEGLDIMGNHFVEETETENVSINGACIKISRKIPKDTRIKISALKFPFEATAIVEVVWMDELDGQLKMGIRFLNKKNNWILR